MTPKTWDFLVSVASDSFKREVDLDESVWRTLPFFVGAFGLALTLLSYISTASRTSHATWSSVLTYILFATSLGAFGWAFRWFWTVVSPQEYQYPPSDQDLLIYAEGLTSYHKRMGLAGEALDDTVAEEMKVFVAGQLAAASGHNREKNAIKVLARSQAILFLMVGFALAIVTEAVIFVDNRAYGAEEISNDAAEGSGAGRPPEGRTQATGAPQGSIRNRGSEPNEGLVLPPQGRQAQMNSETTKGPSEPQQPQPQPTPQRPTPPEPQLLKKSEDPPRRR